MRIALIDADNDMKDFSKDKVFPNLPLMKLSAWHKKNGNLVEWYDPLVAPYKDEYDVVYISKVFSFTEDPAFEINARHVVRGGLVMPLKFRIKRKHIGKNWIRRFLKK